MTTEYEIAAEAVRRGELCYFCRERPPARTGINPRTGVQIPTCSACWEEQRRLGKISAMIRPGCCLLGLSALACPVLFFTVGWRASVGVVLVSLAICVGFNLLARRLYGETKLP
jgi:hypothetical protein